MSLVLGKNNNGGVQSVLHANSPSQNDEGPFVSSQNIHEALPAEILLAIFAFLPCEARIDTALDHLPWILGQVCSKWRKVSRSDAQLWGNPKVYLPRSTICVVQRGLDLLPPFTNLSIKISSGFDMASVAPYLHRSSSLSVQGHIGDFDALWKAVPLDGFVNLESLRLELTDRFPRETADIYCDFHLICQSLCHAGKLRHVNLTSNEAWSRTLMSIELPWQQLESLELTVLIDLSGLCHVLQECVSLVSLDLDVSLEGPQSVTRYSSNVISLSNLRHLHIYGDPDARLFSSFQTWETLTELYLPFSSQFYPGEILQDALNQSVNLRSLSLHVPARFPHKTLTMPLLQSLYLTYESTTSDAAFALFDFPALERLDIRDNCYLNLASLPDMLERSKASLTDFSYHSIYSTTQPQPTTALVRNLLAAPSLATRITIPTIAVEACLLCKIGRREILPCLQYIECITQSADDIADILEAHITRRRAHDSPKIAAICWKLRAISESEIGEARLRSVLHGYQLTIEEPPFSYDYNGLNPDQRARVHHVIPL
ncbi:hypothetical protein H0H93_006593 [Arthromyces matolae]|nr:hypothetical protein H0H93_006593 [Arthromyces matolae]